MNYLIPGDCHSCRFFSDTEDGDWYCAAYNKFSDMDKDPSPNDDGEGKPVWCLIDKVTFEERPSTVEDT